MPVIDKIVRYNIMAGFGSVLGYMVLTRYYQILSVYERCQFLMGTTPNPPKSKMAFMVIAVVF
jgi:hypothetical protein